MLNNLSTSQPKPYKETQFFKKFSYTYVYLDLRYVVAFIVYRYIHLENVLELLVFRIFVCCWYIRISKVDETSTLLFGFSASCAVLFYIIRYFLFYSSFTIDILPALYLLRQIIRHAQHLLHRNQRCTYLLLLYMWTAMREYIKYWTN